MRPARLLSACLAMLVLPAMAPAADASDVAAHDLGKVAASEMVSAAQWMREPDSYTLKVVLDRERFAAKQRAVVAANKERMARDPNPAPGLDRGQYFIDATIASLRGAALWFPCGRIPRIQPVSAPAPARERRVEAWLLGADGTHIQPAGYNCSEAPDVVEVLYRYAVADIGKAVAAAVRVDGDYYIEQLPPLIAQPVR